ncbi:hypothetical protein HHK36_012726 [Tetracentron sinense]|uniref:Thiolase C-terminal domain-containing protein n=1 Tax=Tetracentron sinense TaxID=13715 RepID=A0A834Z7C8_TETSI|nr:hypothetical protein HHK36_012726 [Tetracentron sinense]
MREIWFQISERGRGFQSRLQLGVSELPWLIEQILKASSSSLMDCVGKIFKRGFSTVIFKRRKAIDLFTKLAIYKNERQTNAIFIPDGVKAHRNHSKGHDLALDPGGQSSKADLSDQMCSIVMAGGQPRIKVIKNLESEKMLETAIVVSVFTVEDDPKVEVDYVEDGNPKRDGYHHWPGKEVRDLGKERLTLVDAKDSSYTGPLEVVQKVDATNAVRELESLSDQIKESLESLQIHSGIEQRSPIILHTTKMRNFSKVQDHICSEEVNKGSLLKSRSNLKKWRSESPKAKLSQHWERENQLKVGESPVSAPGMPKPSSHPTFSIPIGDREGIVSFKCVEYVNSNSSIVQPMRVEITQLDEGQSRAWTKEKGVEDLRVYDQKSESVSSSHNQRDCPSSQYVESNIHSMPKFYVNVSWFLCSATNEKSIKIVDPKPGEEKPVTIFVGDGIQLNSSMSFAVVGVDPAVMRIGSAVAIPAAVKSACLELDDIDLLEINEAFASQYVYCCKKLELDLEKKSMIMEEMARSFTRRFFTTEEAVTLSLLSKERHGIQEDLVDFIRRFRQLALDCHGPVTEDRLGSSLLSVS